MGFAALTSGGKDSILSVQKAIDQGIEVTHLVTVRPENPDSFMFHSSNLDAVPVIADLSGIGYVEIHTKGEKENELKDLSEGLRNLEIEGITVGAVNSRYQNDRVNTIADELDIEVFAPLWHMDPEQLLREVAERMDAIIIVTAADGLSEDLLGRHIDNDLIEQLMQISARKHIHLAGEGGEYETLALNAPFYPRPLRYTGTRVIHHGAGRNELILGGFS
jgi:ABC transporter with metal-binding/Fe-S-binding domain ATP-binding protein